MLTVFYPLQAFLLLVYLLVFSSSRGRIHKSTGDENYVENFYSVEEGEEKTVQNTDKRQPELNQEEHAMTYYDLPEDLEDFEKRSVNCAHTRTGTNYIMYVTMAAVVNQPRFA